MRDAECSKIGYCIKHFKYNNFTCSCHDNLVMVETSLSFKQGKHKHRL